VEGIVNIVEAADAAEIASYGYGQQIRRQYEQNDGDNDHRRERKQQPETNRQSFTPFA
jgi:hypothetical protein